MAEQRNNSAEKRAFFLILALLCMYLGAIVVLAVNGRYLFFNKTLIVPSLILVAAATRNFRRFAHQWSIFLSLVILFDGLRGVVYHLILVHDLPVYLKYAIRAEQALFGETIPTISLQGLLFADQQLGFLESFLTIVHGSHFLFFLFFGFLLWNLRSWEFPRFRTGMLLIMLLGLIGYLAVPTVPPWMAADEYSVFSRIDRIYMQVYNLNAPVVSRIFAFNPIAAMPSLHTAFPAFIALVSLRVWKRRGLIALAYLLLMGFALVYGGEHYFVDEAAGAALALLAYGIVYHWRTPAAAARWLNPIRENGIVRRLDNSLVFKLLLTALFLLASEGANRRSMAGFRSLEPSDEFIRSELVGVSPKAHLLLGGSAFNRGNYGAAAAEFQLALAELENTKDVATAHRFLALSAYHDGNLDLAARSFSQLSLSGMNVAEGITYARCHFESGRLREGMDVLTEFERAQGKSVVTIGEKYNRGWRGGLLSTDDLEADLAFLATLQDDPDARRLARDLGELAPGDGAEGNQ